MPNIQESLPTLRRTLIGEVEQQMFISNKFTYQIAQQLLLSRPHNTDLHPQFKGYFIDCLKYVQKANLPQIAILGSELIKLKL